jgi:hypothetical protein
MARDCGEENEARSTQRRHYRTRSRSPPPVGNDWDTGGDVGRSSMRHSVPYRSDWGSRDIEERLHRSQRKYPSYPHLGASNPIPTPSRPNVIMSAGDNPSVRSYTSAQYEHGRGPPAYHPGHPDQYRYQISGTGSRRSSRRDHTPGSPHYSVSPSTPVSKISSRTSLSESDRETAVSQSSVDEDDSYGRGSVKASRAKAETRRRRRHRKQWRETLHEIHPDEEEEEPEGEQAAIHPPVPPPEIVEPESEAPEQEAGPAQAATESENDTEVKEEGEVGHSYPDKVTRSRPRSKRTPSHLREHYVSESRTVAEPAPASRATRRYIPPNRLGSLMTS